MFRSLFIALLFIIVTLANPSFSFAQNVSTQSALQNVSYDLPYPGLLPDNPLYYLKALRDNILKLIIRDAVKKAEFDLLQADKRLGAAKALLDKGKEELAITTLSKSGNYFDDGITNIFRAKREGSDVEEFLNKMITASQKHQLVIREMQKGKSGETLTNLRFQEARANDFQERLEIIKND